MTPALVTRSLGVAYPARVRSAESGASLDVAASPWEPHPAAATPLLSGQFARFDEWAEVANSVEGRFLEIVDQGAFSRSMKEDRSRLRILFDHGADPSIGRKPIAAVELLGEDIRGGFYGGYLFPVDYALQLVPALRAGQLGSSFRFAVVRETTQARPGRSSHNPEGLPERRIREARLVELGPTPFPVYAGTSANARSEPRAGARYAPISAAAFIASLRSKA